MARFLLSSVVLAGCLLAPGLASNASAAQDIVAFCHTHPTLDYPGQTYFGAAYKPGMLPPEVEARELGNWRCMDGKVLMCSNSADGDSCARKDPSRIPSQDIKDDCTDNGLVTRATSAYSASTWRCVNKSPVIDQTWRLDTRGFMSVMWLPYVVEHGKGVKPQVDDFPPPR